MFVENLKIRDFRNIEYADITLSPKLNVFYGENAQGKTNALESLFICSSSKSFRTAKDNDFVNFGKEKAKIETVFSDNGVQSRIELTVKADGGKNVLLDGFECKKSSDYIGKILTVVFTPGHLSLVYSSPEERRKFLDLAICQSRPVIINLYRTYSKLIKQKNSLLSAGLKGAGIDTSLIDVFNIKLSELCEKISIMRNELCEKLTELASPTYYDMTCSREKLVFEYSNSVGGNFGKESYYKLLSDNMQSETERGISIYGIHRDDIKIKINGKSVREFGSQGQQRSTVLAMKLAEGDYLSEKRNSMPVFLFDDVLSELDKQRREFILDRIKDRQVILTSCNEDYLINEEHLKYSVKNGVYTKL